MDIHEGMPIVDQYLLQILPAIPSQIRRAPGSREFRAALRVLAARTGLLPTRKETRDAVHRLQRRGLVELAPADR